MDILGYSERGLLNALFYEIAESAIPEEKLTRVIWQRSFPSREQRPPVGTTEVLMEQSFSDFGDADAVVLIDSPSVSACSVFIEAKVKTYQLADWSIERELQLFELGMDGANRKMDSSNLFAQLYHKMRMAEGLRNLRRAGLENGLVFPLWSSKELRKIGRNQVVCEATSRVERHLNKVFYLAIVPDNREIVEQQFTRSCNALQRAGASELDVAHLSFVTWADIRRGCEEETLLKTLRVFDYNRGQIYRI